MSPKFQKRSALKFVGRNEAETSKAKRIEVFLAELSNSQRLLEIIPGAKRRGINSDISVVMSSCVNIAESFFALLNWGFLFLNLVLIQTSPTWKESGSMLQTC